MKIRLSLLVTYLALFALPAAEAQTEEQLDLRLSRDFGYSSGSGKIQGTFSMRVTAPEAVRRVVFYIDGEPLGEDSELPFRLRFSTGSYSLGAHSMSAEGYTADGRVLQSNVVRAEFVTAEEGWKAGLRIGGPLLILVVVIMLLSFVVPLISSRGKTQSLAPGTPRAYSFFGGAICPKCGRPFAMHLFGLNVGFKKYDRCPYCGRWSLVSRRSLPELRAAEAAELEQAAASEPTFMSEEEHLKRDLESSRYEEL